MRLSQLKIDKIAVILLTLYAIMLLVLLKGSYVPVRYILLAVVMPVLLISILREFEFKFLVLFFLTAGIQLYFDNKLVITNFLPFIPFFLFFIFYRHPLFRFEYNYLTVPFLLSFSLFVVNFFSSTRPVETIYMMINYGQAVVVYFYLVHYINDKEDYLRTVKIIAVSLIIPLAVGLFQALTMSSMALDHVKGMLNSRNEFAPYLAFHFFLFLGFFVYAKGLWLKIGLIAVISAIFWVFLNTFSRGALVGMMMAIAVYLFLLIPKKYKLAFPVVIIVIVIALMLFMNFGGAKYLSRFNMEQLDTATIVRVGLWEAAIKMFTEKPILGFGLNTFGEHYIYYYPVLRGELSILLEFHHKHAHNIILNTLAEQGLAGLAVLLVSMVFVAAYLVKLFRERNSQLTKIASPLLIAYFVYFMGHNIFDTVWHAYHHIALQIQFAVYLALVSSLGKIEHNE